MTKEERIKGIERIIRKHEGFKGYEVSDGLASAFIFFGVFLPIVILLWKLALAY